MNCVAPGPIWTPPIPSTMAPEKVKSFGQQVPIDRLGQAEEPAPAYVVLASGGELHLRRDHRGDARQADIVKGRAAVPASGHRSHAQPGA